MNKTFVSDYHPARRSCISSHDFLELAGDDLSPPREQAARYENTTTVVLDKTIESAAAATMLLSSPKDGIGVKKATKPGSILRSRKDHIHDALTLLKESVRSNK